MAAIATLDIFDAESNSSKTVSSSDRLLEGAFCASDVLSKYRVVKLNFTPEIEAFYMLFERSLSIFSNISQTAYSVKSSWANLYKDIERL